MNYNLPLFPEAASTLASRVDALYFFLIAISLFFSLLIAGLIIYFAIVYRRDVHREAQQIHGSNLLEAVWTLIPLGLTMIIFVWGASLYFDIQRPPRGSMEIYCIGKQWMWKFEHQGGQREINELHIPVGRPVEVTMISQDVIHSLYIPAFRVKQDVLPGRYTTEWFTATRPGRYHLFCAEYCGTNHSAMVGQVIAMRPQDYETWLAGGTAQGSMAANGEVLFQTLGCATCHRADASARGPNLFGLYGQPVKLADGRVVTANEAYIRESILTPTAKIVEGFQPIMPSFQGQVSEEQILQLIAYVRSMAQPKQPQPLSNRTSPLQRRVPSEAPIPQPPSPGEKK